MKKFNNIKKFWLKKSLELLYWGKKPNISFINKNNFFRWFVDGRLNVFENCIARSGNANIKQNFKKTAIITVSANEVINKYSYNDIYELVLILSFFLKKFKNKNTKVLIHSSATIESAVSMLACANLGMHFCVLFKELELEAINSRIKIFKPSIILSNGDPNLFKKIKSNKKLKIFNLKKLLKKNNKKNIIFNKSHKIGHYKGDRDLFTLFTSGSTGSPKGITHATAGYLLYAKYTCMEQFGMNSESVVLTASDAGWINGHTYSLFGPLSIGATTILMEKPMILLNKSLLDKILKEKVSVLYLPVTLIRLMREIYKNKIFRYDTLITLGSMGEPLAKSVGVWFAKTFNLANKAIINTYYQTETSGIICSPKYTDNSKISPHGSVGRVVSNVIQITNLKRKKKEIKINAPWPGCMKNVINGYSYYKKYWDKNNKFRMFDFATKNNSYIEIHGRTDDVINIRGHRIGSEEIESILLKNKKIIEACAVAIPDDLEGFSLVLFLVINNSRQIDQEIKKSISSNFGLFALPKKIIYLSALPKTRSGKILRRLLRDILLKPYQNNYGDISTIINPQIINEIKNKVNIFTN
jgi:acetyl-CoA synthetase